MKAITIYSVYALLIAKGLKQNETRKWRPKTKPGRFAIHSAASMPPDVARLLEFEPMSKLLKGEELPFGKIIATAEIDTITTATEWIRKHCQRCPTAAAEREYLVGDYDPKNFVWKLKDVRRLPEAIECKGAQQFWNVPEEIVAEIERQEKAMEVKK